MMSTVLNGPDLVLLQHQQPPDGTNLPPHSLILTIRESQMLICSRTLLLLRLPLLHCKAFVVTPLIRLIFFYCCSVGLKHRTVVESERSVFLHATSTFDVLFTLNEPLNPSDWMMKSARMMKSAPFSVSSGTTMTMTKTERKRRSAATTGPCCPISVQQLEEAAKAVPTGCIDSSVTGS